MVKSMDELLTDREAARLLNLKVQTLRNWRFQGRGPAYHKFGAAVRYAMEDIKAYRDQSRVSPQQ
ncbi:helix-turn-helix domain-containing protein [uncultured Desulfosarcina sp.]|uniref:helix-turn-helix domain-containing protein n=1 Tax=uncultured Desulfosarcina sp. TaxID=218289 RepID=UPI0029C66323|nr:helix-turn-helix domain-containing protein [uncultured Desulfosarcina sp.]